MKNIERNVPYEPEVLDKLHAVQIEMLNDLDEICKKNNIQYFGVFGTALGAIRHKGFIPWDDDIDVAMLRDDYNRFIEIVRIDVNGKYQIMTPEIDSNYACCVTKFQKKGTKFISHLSDKLNCDQCIFIDIFPYDCVPNSENLKKKQYLKTLFLDRLIYLCGSAHPIIPYGGIKGELAAIVCYIAHYILKVFHISPRMLYRKFVKECVKYNKLGIENVTTFGDGACLNYVMSIENSFPLTRVQFENTTLPLMQNYDEHLKDTYGDYMKLPPEDQRVNHAPYIIEFGDEKI